MKLRIDQRAYPISDCVFKSIAINCWTDDNPPQRFVIVVTEPYAQHAKWDLAQGLQGAVAMRYEEILVLAQAAADNGENGLWLA